MVLVFHERNHEWVFEKRTFCINQLNENDLNDLKAIKCIKLTFVNVLSNLWMKLWVKEGVNEIWTI